MLRQQKDIVNNIIHRRIISEEQLFLIIKYSSNAIKTDFFDHLTELISTVHKRSALSVCDALNIVGHSIMETFYINLNYNNTLSKLTGFCF